MKKYFFDLNYTMANEDTTLEYEMVKVLKPDKILSICGSGGRAIPLIASKPKMLDVIDISKSQLLLFDLRVSTIKYFDYDGFLKFWGYPPYQAAENCDFRRESFFKMILEDDCRIYFDTIFNREEWKSVLYLGKWEKTFQIMCKICRLILGSASNDIFKHQTIEAQREYVRTEFPWWRWKIVLLLLGNKSMFNALLYKGDFVKKNVNESHYEYYDKAYRSIFENMNARESFFLQLCYLGKIVYPEGNTIEAKESAFLEIKDSLSTVELNKFNKDLLSALDGTQKYDFVSMSDVPSYFQGEVERNFLQDAKKSLTPGAVVVIRSYLREPQANIDGYLDITNEFSKLIKLESVQMYRIRILKLDNV